MTFHMLVIVLDLLVVWALRVFWEWTYKTLFYAFAPIAKFKEIVRCGFCHMFGFKKVTSVKFLLMDCWGTFYRTSAFSFQPTNIVYIFALNSICGNYCAFIILICMILFHEVLIQKLEPCICSRLVRICWPRMWFDIFSPRFNILYEGSGMVNGEKNIMHRSEC